MVVWDFFHQQYQLNVGKSTSLDPSWDMELTHLWTNTRQRYKGEVFQECFGPEKKSAPGEKEMNRLFFCSSIIFRWTIYSLDISRHTSWGSVLDVYFWYVFVGSKYLLRWWPWISRDSTVGGEHDPHSGMVESPITSQRRGWWKKEMYSCISSPLYKIIIL